MRPETMMGLVTVSLMLLVGVQAQHGVIDSETDFLPQAIDQHINVDHELEAIETIVNPSSHLQFSSTGQLPFGARLPTYENTQFAYGYTIQDTSQLPVAQQSTNVSHNNRPNQRTATSHHTKFKTASHLSHLKRYPETNTDTLSSLSSHRINSNGALLPIAPISEETNTDILSSASSNRISSNGALLPIAPISEETNTDTLSSSNSNRIHSNGAILPIAPFSEPSISVKVPDVPLDIQLMPPKNDFLQSASQIRALPPAPPPDSVSESKVQPLLSVDSSYLPPVLDFKTESPQILTPPASDYLPPVKEFEDEPSKPFIPVNTYIPPVEAKIEPSTEPPQPSNEYLPPLEQKTEPEGDLPQPVSEYIPPAEDKTEPEFDSPQPVSEYLPPVKEYIPPVKGKTEPESDPPQIVSGYIPPEKVESSPSQPPPSDQYLPPLEDKSLTTESPVNDIPKTGFPESTPRPIIPIPRLTPKPPPASPPNFETPSPPIGLKTEPHDHHIISGSKQNNQHTLPPRGSIGESKETPIITYYENPRLSAFGIVGIAEESRIIPGKDESNFKPLSPISESNNRHITPHRENPNVISPIGIATNFEDAVITPVKFENPSPSLPIVVGNEISLKPLPPTGLVHIDNDHEIKAITARPPAPPPFAVLTEYEDNHIQPQKGTGPILLPAISQKNYGCLVNSECSDSQICMDGMCVNACVIAVGLCVGNAVCQTQRHTPGCVCPNMFTAITIRKDGQAMYDCRPMMMMSNQGNPNTDRFNGITAGRPTNFHQFSRPISDFRNPHGGIRLPTLSVLCKMN